MKGFLKALVLLGLVFALIFPMLAQAQDDDFVPTQEVVEVVPDVVAPVATSPMISPDVMAIAGSLILILGLGFVFVLLSKAMDALKVSVPQEAYDLFATRLIEVFKQARDSVGEQVRATPSPIDDMALAIADVPIDFIVKELHKRIANPDVGISTEAAASIAALKDKLLTI